MNVFATYCFQLSADDDVGFPANGGESSGVPFHFPVIVILKPCTTTPHFLPPEVMTDKIPDVEKDKIWVN